MKVLLLLDAKECHFFFPPSHTRKSTKREIKELSEITEAEKIKLQSFFAEKKKKLVYAHFQL